MLGAASIARRSMIPAIAAVDGVELAGVAARDPERARGIAEPAGAEVYDGYDALITASDVDAVYIPLPTGLHADWAVRALRAGKHVLSEKSLAATYADCLRMVEAAESAERVLIENFMCETHPQSLFVRDLIAAGEIGRVASAELAFGFPAFAETDIRNDPALGGGALGDAGAYCLDMAAFYLGAPPVSVHAVIRAGARVDVSGTATLVFADGAVATATWGFGYDYRNEASFWGESGRIEIDRAFSIPADRAPRVTVTRNTTATPYDLAAADQFATQVARFRDLTASPWDAGSTAPLRRQAALMEAVRRSAADGRAVRLDEVDAPDPASEEVR